MREKTGTGLQVWLCVGLITENGNYARKNELISEHVIFPYLEDKHKIGRQNKYFRTLLNVIIFSL
jgi:hypothetical protein